ncbi:MAG: DUF1906 domain-containing protein [Clostridia bacterium]|nr:DUF1906 domain-containing protein [Clostridia bacterium]
MKLTKRLFALLLTLVLTLALFPLGMISASALEGMGAPTDMNYYALGVDISYWQAGDSTGKNVDFNKLKASGCEFVILRLGYGQSVDKAFLSFYKNARAAGMPLGVYLYGLKTTKSGAASDAAWAISVFEQHNMYFEYPIFYDIEEADQIALSSANATALCEGWCDTLKAKGYYPGIYSGTQFFNKLTSSFKQNNDLWIAHVLNGAGSEWSSQFTHTSKAYNTQGYSMWQYSWSNIKNGSSYIYNGIYKSGTTKVEALDLDVCYKDYPSIMKANGYNNCQSNSKPSLLQSINKAKELRYSSYDSASLTALRNAFDNAVSVYNNDSATETDIKAAKTALDNAMVVSGKIVLSGNCNYTSSVTARTEFNDSNNKLTNGVKSSSTVSIYDSTYAAYYHSGDVEITIDLGSEKTSNLYTAYVASNFWGIPLPNSVKVSYSDSATGTFTEIAGNLSIQKVGDGDIVDGTAYSELYTMTYAAKNAVTARYIKFTINCNAYFWIDELEVASGGAPLSGGIYVSGVNSRIESGDCHIYTPSFGEITVSNANHAWTINVIATKQPDGNFMIDSVTSGEGTATPTVKLNADQIFIAAHNWESGISDGTQVIGSAANSSLLYNLKPGDVIALDGITITDAVNVSAAPYIKIISTSGVVDGEHVHEPSEPHCGQAPYCIKCNEVLGEASDHVLGDWTLTDDGKMEVRQCKDCGYTAEARYVSSGTTPEPDPDPENLGLRGDINQNGKIDARDYLLLKRAYFGTYDLNNVTTLLADVNENGTVDARDYLLLKRAYFGTYTIANPYVYE